MAYALAPYLCKLKLCRIDFPEDVAELIDGMLDWRYELVQGGGKTPSASCVNQVPDYLPGRCYAPLDYNIEYIIVENMPQFELNYRSYVAESELHPSSRSVNGSFQGPRTPTRITLWRYALRQQSEESWLPGDRLWTMVRRWTLGRSSQVKHRAMLGGA